MPIPTAKFAIFIRTADGREIEAFRWTRDAASGMARVIREAAEFGYGEVEAWASPVAGGAA